MLRRQRRRARRRLIMISDKVRPHHLERKAILYVRQSSAHQVLHNRESSALQYAIRDRLTALGWSEIEYRRLADQNIIRKVTAEHRLRNSRDWQQLIEMSRVGRYRSGR